MEIIPLSIYINNKIDFFNNKIKITKIELIIIIINI